MTIYLHRPMALPEILFQITYEYLKAVGRKGVEPLSTGSEPVVLTITLPTENPATFTSSRTK